MMVWAYNFFVSFSYKKKLVKILYFLLQVVKKEKGATN